MNDYITPATLSSAQQNLWYASATYTDTPVTSTYTYGALSASVTYYMQKTTIKSDTYNGNYASGGKGLIDIIGMPRVHIDSVTFTNNGDSIKEVVSTYGAANGGYQIYSVSGSEMTITQAYTGSPDSTSFCQGMIKITRAREFTLFGTSFDSNWLLEYNFNSLRAQLVTLSEFYGEFKIDQIIVKNQKGMTNIAAAIGGSALVPASPAINKIASMQPLFKWQSTDLMRFLPLITTGTTSEFTNIYYHHAHTGYSVDRMFWPALTYSSSTFVANDFQMTSVAFTNIQCYGCQLSPFFIHSKSVIWNSVTMTSINTLSYTDTANLCSGYFSTCKQVKPFFEFNMREYLTATNYDSISITGMQVTTYYGGCNDGRLFDFTGVSGGLSTTPMVQVTFTNSRFSQIYFDCDGAFAKVNLLKIQMKIDGRGGTAPQKTFETIYARYTSTVGFGGVLYIISLNKLFLNNIKAEDFKVGQNTATNGGGRFLYYKQNNQNLLLDIRSSELRCSSTSTAFDSSLQLNTRLSSSYYDQASAIHAESTFYSITMDMLDTTIEHCYNSLNGAAIFFVSPISKTIRLTRNYFNYNVALSGGAIYCEKCLWDTMLQNNFLSNYAQYGGDIYFKDSKTYPITLQSHVHDSSVALTSGAAIFLHDVRNAASIGGSVNYPQLIINKAASGTSDFKNNDCNPSGCNGGAVAVRSLEKVDFQVSSTSFTSNRAGANGAAIFIEGTINSKAVTVALTSSTFTSNTALTSASVLYIPSAASTSQVTIADTDFTSNAATSGDGGLFYMSAATSNSILFNNYLVSGGVGIDSIVNVASSGNNGGVFYFNGGTNSLTIDDKTQIKSATAAQNGGMVYIQGTLSAQQNYVYIYGGYLENIKATSGSGGLAYFTGTATHNFNAQTTNSVDPVIKTVSANSHGGVLYMNGATHTVNLNGLQCDTVSTNGEGGFLYSTTSTTSLNVQIANTKMLGVSAITQGSMISLRKGSSDPTLTMNINTNSQFQCLSQDLEPNVVTIQTTLAGSSSTLGGAFYFDSLATGSTIVSSASTYYNCYTATSGAVFYLPPNVVFTDTGSTFKQNAAFKGTIYCSSCTATLTNSVFKDNIAQDGSLFHMVNDASLTLTNPTLSNGRARRYGGAIYAGGTGTYFSGATQLRPKITIQSCTNIIEKFDAISKGGFMYIDHPQMILVLSSCSYKDLYAGVTGGFIEGAQYQDFGMSSCTSMKNISAGTSGSFIKTTHPNAKFSLTSCNFECDKWNVQPTSATVGGSVTQGSLIEITNALQVTSNTNTFKYCYLASQGSIFKVASSSSFTDTNSVFEYNSAKQGGVIYLDTTSATFTGSEFSHNFGLDGGTFYITGQQTLRLQNCKSQSSYATGQGGFIYATESTGTQTVAIEVQTTSSISTNIDYSNIHADLEGGMFYLAGELTSLDIEYTGAVSTDRIKFDTISSSKSGGLVYSNSLKGIIIKKADFDTITSDVSGGIMYNQRVSSIEIEDSTFTSVQAINGGGGLAYIASTATNLASVSLTRVTATSVISKLSGSMIYSISTATAATFSISNSYFYCQSSAFTTITSTSSDSGGAFYIKNAQQVTSTQNTIKYCYLANSGGAFYIENSKLTDSQSVISDNAAIHGGAISCVSCSSLTLTQTVITHHEASTSNGKGGVLYLENVQATTLDRVTITKGEAKDKGGLAYIVGTVNPASFTIDNLATGTPLQLEEFKAATSGGGIYVDHPLLSIYMTKPVAIKDSKALGGSGGFFYFNQVGQVTLGALTSSLSTYQDVSSTISGSFLYSVATGLDLRVQKSSVDCTLLGQQSTSFAIDLTSTLGITTPTSSRGGAFYIKDASSATQVNTLTLFNCYTGDTGGAFSLINTELKDQTSRYYHNGAIKGGAVYCDNCWMELNDVKYYWSQAYDGGTFYITTLKNTGSTTKMVTSVTIQNSKAFYDGGSFHILGTSASKDLDISSMVIDLTTANNNGGLMYVNNKLQSIVATDLTLTNSLSLKSGGVFYVKDSNLLTISEITSTKSSYSTFNAPDYGSFMYSESTTLVLSISDTDIECQSSQLLAAPSHYSTWSSLTPTSDRAGAFYIKDAIAIIMSSRNNYLNCYTAKQGGVYSLVKSKLQELQSVYQYNSAILGGVFHLDDSKLDITSAQILNTYAGNGGIIYKIGKEDLSIKSTIITSSQVKVKGGLGYFTEQTSFTSSDTFILSLSSPLTQITTLTDIQADSDGGAFYFDSKQISAVNFDSIAITNSKSNNENGGVIYTNKIAGLVTITSSIFKTFSAPKQGSFLYSGSDIQFGLITTSSQFDCKITAYDPLEEKSKVILYNQGTFGGAFYIKDSSPGVVSTLSFFRNCYTTFEGGAFYLTNTKLVDTKSKFMLNSANEGGSFKCNKCQITLTDSEVRDNDAFNGGAIYSVNEITLTATRTIFYNNKAKNNGGVLSVNNQASTVLTATSITFQSCDSIYRNKADYGAFAYYDNDYAELNIFDSQIKNHTAYKRSAYIEALTMGKSKILNSFLSDFYAPETTLMHSVAKNLNMNITDSDIICDSLYQDPEAYQYINSITLPSSTHNTKFYIQSATNVTLKQNRVSMCGTSLYGGVFWLSQGTKFYDYKSTFEFNSGANGGVINCQTCLMELQNTFFQSNKAWRGGVIEVKEAGYLKTIGVKFDRNIAYLSAGVIYVNTFSYMELHDSEFTNNQAPEDSAIEVLQGSRSKNITIEDCFFEKNKALKNTISLRDANVVIKKTRIQNNQAKYLSKHLFIGFSNVYIEDTQFRGTSNSNPKMVAESEETLGSHLYAILSSKVWIKDSYFLDGTSKLGGAMYIEGNSSIDMIKTVFQNNYAKRKGGAIYANGFNLLRTSGNSQFMNNQANEDGDDIYISNTEGYFQLENTMINNPSAITSIAAENVNISLNYVTMQNIGVTPHRALTQGSGLSCYNCRAINVENSKFTNLNSLRGGAIYIEESEDNKYAKDTYGKYRISKTRFESCTSLAGGAIYLNNPQFVTIDQDTVFKGNMAKNSSNESFKKFRGSGGAIYYECDENILRCMVDLRSTYFTNNFAQIKGGAIHWSTIEPLWGGRSGNSNFSSNHFSRNQAARYGNSISTFASQIAIISEKDFKESMYSTTKLFQPNRNQRLLQANTTSKLLDNSTQVLQNVTYTTETAFNEMRSGGTIPKMYIGLVDKYGQIVASDDDSKISVMIDAFAANKLDSNQFPPFIEGSTSYTVQNGVVQVKDIAFAASPGYNYSLSFQSLSVKPDISSRENNDTDLFLGLVNFKNLSQFMINQTEKDLSVKVDIKLRECEAGEQFQWNGKCSQCPTNTSFSLIKMNEPGTCQVCPSDKAVCYGGTNVGPAAGHWRSSNISSNFLTCLYKPACLGMIPPLDNPIGQCAQGYQGIMCADCQPGYSRSREYQCSKCPSQAWVVGRMFIIFIVVLIVVLILISSKSKTRYLHVYLRMLINHIQLILLIAAFNYNWPEILQNFFDFARPVSRPFSEFLDLHCLANNYISGERDNKVGMRFILIQTIFLAILPLLFVALAWIGVKIQQAYQRKNRIKTVSKVSQDIEKTVGQQEENNQSGKIIQAFTMMMFLAYPNIMQFMLSLFKCVDIDGQMRLKLDLEVVCWSPNHQLFAYVVALPSLIVWGIGLPILAFILLTNKRADIASANNPNTHETFGFIYGGFKADFYFWEVIITIRKLILISVCIFVTNYGVLTQALLTLLVLILFLVLTARKRPFIGESLFDLEAISLATAMISVYCGLFYLADTTQIGISNFDKSSDVTFSLAKNSKTFLLSSIIGINGIFFVYWLYRVFSEMEALRGFILKTFPTLYLLCFACGDKDQAYIDKQKNKVLNENEGHKEELMRILRNVKELYNRGDLLLNDEVMRRLRQHINPEKVLQVAGVVDQNDEELTRKIQMQLQKQYEIQFQNAQLSGMEMRTREQNDISKYHHHRSVIGSLLTNGDKDEPQDAQQSYLQVLQALKQNHQDAKQYNDDQSSFEQNDNDHIQPTFGFDNDTSPHGDLLQSQNFDESDVLRQANLEVSRILHRENGLQKHRPLNTNNLFGENNDHRQLKIADMQFNQTELAHESNTSLEFKQQFMTGLDARKIVSAQKQRDDNDALVDDEVESQNIQEFLDKTRQKLENQQVLPGKQQTSFPKVVGKLMISTGNSFNIAQEQKGAGGNITNRQGSLLFDTQSL